MVFASQLFSSEEQERAFRGRVEGMLRDGEPDLALAEIDARLNDISASPFARLAMTVDPDSVKVTGWGSIGRNIESLDLHGQPISAVSIDFADPAAAGRVSDSDMKMRPVLETSYYCDDVYAFSTSDRATINSGYGRAGSRWQGGYEHLDREVNVTGLDALYGAYHSVLPHMERGELTELADYDAPRLCAMRAAVLLHRAIARAIAEEGLIRPMAILCGSNDDYPYFDAPVTSRAEYDEATDAQAESGDTDEALFTSLATLAPAAPVAQVRQVSSYQFTPETDHVSGRSLRHRFVRELQENANDETGEPVEEEAKATSLFGRLFRRSA
ncbi:hypothetical protein [Croceicoccus bisphenolivorans]|uniref:hypothetical protein n=1 Tax=Croceicoccus bisphenolivorans TaxID=1783232 RepID=UPI000836ED3E|nr:hypothetical protein [Croceicoccus bisphenolivorans]